MRPRTLDEFVGQEHFLGPGKLLRRMLAGRPAQLARSSTARPARGKTALAHVIAHQTKSRFKPLNAVAAGIKEVREVLSRGPRTHLEDDGERTILFLDEIHRFNRAQQDVLLPDVEDGVVILIGATTQNPFFAINTPLLSRSQIFTFEPLEPRPHPARSCRGALADTERGLGDVPVTLDRRRAGVPGRDVRRRRPAGADGAGDRGEVGARAGERRGPRCLILFDLALAQDSIQRKVLDFDPTGDTHYDVA